MKALHAYIYVCNPAAAWFACMRGCCELLNQSMLSISHIVIAVCASSNLV